MKTYETGREREGWGGVRERERDKQIDRDTDRHWDRQRHRNTETLTLVTETEWDRQTLPSASLQHWTVQKFLSCSHHHQNKPLEWDQTKASQPITTQSTNRLPHMHSLPVVFTPKLRSCDIQNQDCLKGKETREYVGCFGVVVFENFIDPFWELHWPFFRTVLEHCFLNFIFWLSCCYDDDEVMLNVLGCRLTY